MAEQNPCFVLQGSNHPADGFRRMVKALREQGGVVATGDMAVTQNGTPNMSVNVAAGQAAIDGTENATLQGSYETTNDATKNLTIAASDPTNPRNDLVVAKVQDSNYSGGALAWSLAVVTGTPAGSPVDPAVPANAIVIARVRVDATVTSIVNAKITDLRAFLHGAVFPGAAGYTVWDSTGALKQQTTDDNGLWTFRNALKVPFAKDVAPAPGTYGTLPVLIDVQAPGAVGSFDFLNPLPTGFAHLEIIWVARETGVVAVDFLNLRFNNDSAANYYRERTSSAGAVVSGTENIGITSGEVGDIPGASVADAAMAGSGRILIPNYGGSIFKKEAHGSGGHSQGLTTGLETQFSHFVLWNNSAAISRITMLVGTGLYVSGSKFWIYGWPG